VLSLSELRTQIDETDRELLAVLGRRFELCHEVAALKGADQVQVLAPGRVQEVLRTRTNWAAEFGVEPEYAELLFRSLLSETHRIEAVHLRGDSDSIEPHADPVERVPSVDTALQTTACRIDHVTVAVADLDEAITFFVDQLGFRVGQSRTTHPDYPGVDSAVVDAGGVTFVLMQAPVARNGEALATGVHHIAIEVLNASYVRAALVDHGAALQTNVLTSANGLERFFTVRDVPSGLQLGFVSRVGDRANFDGGDIAALSAAIETVNDR
jgi:chorismate mutase/catechol 2,3-dioxygenase-like lactoylglutathione lyase family enzyme